MSIEEEYAFVILVPGVQWVVDQLIACSSFKLNVRVGVSLGFAALLQFPEWEANWTELASIRTPAASIKTYLF